MPGVTDGITELESSADGLEQIGIQTAADLLPPKVGHDDACGIATLLQTGERLRTEGRKVGPHPLSDTAEGGGKSKRVVERACQIVLVQFRCIAVVLGSLRAGCHSKGQGQPVTE